MENIIKDLLSPKRFEHSMSVAKLAVEMVEHLGADTQKAYLAGVVHDIAKEMPADDLKKYCDEHGIKLCSIEKNNTVLLHAPVGAELIKEYGILDEDIQNAVRYHTVGRAGMTCLEKIIYLADMIDPERTFPEASELRKIWREDFSLALLKAFGYSISWNVSQGKLIHEGTVQAFNDVLPERKNNK